MLKNLIALLIAFASTTSFSVFAAECWKATSWNSTNAVVASQDCTVTPAGFAWLASQDILDFAGSMPADTYLALDPSIFNGYSNPVIGYTGLDSNGVATFIITVIVGSGNSVPPTTTTPPQASALYWTAWLDRDNASGVGDWEHLSGFSSSQVCEYPVDIEARVRGSNTVYTPLDITPDNLVRFDASFGLACQNGDQVDGRCSDYEVRFQCQVGTWTGWLDRDNASGSGDWELHADFPSSQVCANPIDIRARIVGSNQVFATASGTAENLSVMNTSGLACRNALQNDNYCEDYEVRFLCP